MWPAITLFTGLSLSDVDILGSIEWGNLVFQTALIHSAFLYPIRNFRSQI